MLFEFVVWCLLIWKILNLYLFNYCFLTIFSLFLIGWYDNLHFMIFPFYFLCILCYFPYIWALCQPGAFLWICLLVQKLLQCLWLISSSYAFLVGKFLMSIIYVEFGSHCLSFICPFLFWFLSIRQGFFKKIEVLFEAREWYYLFPKRIHADILRALSVGISPYSNYD